MRGWVGNDVLRGGDGADHVRGNRGADTLYGGGGNDELRGGKANDRLFGDGGADVLFGHLGDDELTGGTGNDIFAFRLGDGYDRILDFTDGQDTIRFHMGTTPLPEFADLQRTVDLDGNVQLALSDGAGNSVTVVLVGVSDPSLITAADVSFVSGLGSSTPPDFAA